jgi:hypothetical protein
VWVCARRKIREAGPTFRDAGQHGVPVRDGFVAGQGEGALKRSGGADDLRRHETILGDVEGVEVCAEPFVPQDGCGVAIKLAAERNISAANK